MIVENEGSQKLHPEEEGQREPASEKKREMQ